MRTVRAIKHKETERGGRVGVFVRFVEGIAFTHTESVCMFRPTYGRHSDERDTRETARARRRLTIWIHTGSVPPSLIH